MNAPSADGPKPTRCSTSSCSTIRSRKKSGSATICTTESSSRFMPPDSPWSPPAPSLLSAEGAAVDTVDRQLLIRGITRTHVSQLAFDNRIQLTELTQTAKSLEDTLLDMTKASAEFAAA